MSPDPNDIKVTVIDVTPAIQAVVKPVSTISVVTETPEIVIVGSAILGPQGPPGDVGPFYEGHTFAILGALDGITVLPSLFVPKHAVQTVKLAGMFADVVSGSVKIQVKRNGNNVGPLVTLTQIAVWTPLGDIPLAHGDKLTAVLSGYAGSPTTLSATIALEWSVVP